MTARKRWCVRGHDTDECGRTSHGRCRDCHRADQRRLYRDRKEERNEYRRRRRAQTLDVPVYLVGDNRQIISGERLKYLRREFGLSQSRLAFLAGLSKSTIKHIEAGRTRPYAVTQRKVLDALAPLLAEREDRRRRAAVAA